MLKIKRGTPSIECSLLGRLLIFVSVKSLKHKVLKKTEKFPFASWRIRGEKDISKQVHSSFESQLFTYTVEVIDAPDSR